MEQGGAWRFQQDVVHQHGRSSMVVRHASRHRSASSSSLNVSVCSNSSNLSSFRAAPTRASWQAELAPAAPDEVYEDYEVVFKEEKLGLTLKRQEQVSAVGCRVPVTTVKSTIFSVGQVSHQILEGDVLQSVNGESIANLEFRDVLRILKTAPRPIRLRFRTRHTQRGLRHVWSFPSDDQEASRRSSASSNSFDSDLRVALAAGSFTLPPPGPQEDRDDSDSQDAVLSESFGDADSTRTTENSSVVPDRIETEFKSARHASRFAAFLRKPFRRSDGFDTGRWEMRMGIVPATPRVEVALESPCKAAIHVYWRMHPKALSCHLQFSRDWTMKVWKNWAGQPRRAGEHERELATTIFGLDFAKSYVVRVRYEFDSSYAPGEWSVASTPILTIGSRATDAMARTRRG